MEPTFFLGKSAWFSSSVDETIRHLWEKHGGTYAGKDNANFLFSEDVDAEDTKSLYSSNAYLREHLAVFHAEYISQVVEASDPSSVVLGDYYLPPPEVIKELRDRPRPKVIQMKKYNSLPNASKDTSGRKRKSSGDTVSLPKSKENVPQRNDQHFSERPNTGKENLPKQPKRPLKVTQVSSGSLGTPHTKQCGEGMGGAMYARRQNYADAVVQTPQRDVVLEAQYLHPLMSTDDCMDYKGDWKAKGNTRNLPLHCQPTPTPTRSQGIQTVEDLHALEMHNTLIVEGVGNLHSQGEVNNEGSLMEYSDTRSQLQHGGTFSHGWNELSHLSPWSHRTGMDQGSSGALVPNPRENFYPRQESDLSQEAAGCIDSLNCTEKGEKEVTPKPSFSCVML